MLAVMLCVACNAAFLRSLDHTAESVAAKGTDDAIVAAVVRRRRMLLYMLLLCLAVVPNYITSPTTLYRRHMGVALLATIENGHPAMWQRVFRMTKPSFNALCGWLASNTMFRRGREVSEREKLLVFLHIVCQGAPQNIVAHPFGRSDETINRLVDLGMAKEYKEPNKPIRVECSMKCWSPPCCSPRH